MATQRSPGIVTIATIEGADAVVLLTAHAVLTVVESKSGMLGGASVELAEDGSPEYVNLIDGVPPPTIMSETLWRKAS